MKDRFQPGGAVQAAGQGRPECFGWVDRAQQRCVLIEYPPQLVGGGCVHEREIGHGADD